MKAIDNKWMRAAVPALLIHCSIGTVYCWSTFKARIADQIGMSPFSVGWAFSLAIFFLGMSAAFAGRMVEKNIKRSSLLSCICFTVGMLGTGLCVQFAKGPLALVGIYIFYGCIMGIGLGVGYLTPVKTLMLWFADRKGLATGISIMGFGLAKAIATPFMELIQNHLGLAQMFYILGCVYFVMMMLGHYLIRKPPEWHEPDDDRDGFHVLSMFSNPVFVGIWIMFFLNIHCGLALITYEKQIVQLTFRAVDPATMAALVSIVPSVTAAFNALGRIGYSTVSDKMRDRNTVYKIIFTSCILFCAAAFATSAIANPSTSAVLGALAVVMLFIVNFGYGGGFSTLPALLASRFGMDKISKIHGLALSAWAAAGLTGNNMSELILRNVSDKGVGYGRILAAVTILYAVGLAISVFVVGNGRKGAKC